MSSDDWIDNERHRKPARKVQGDPRPGSSRRRPPAKPSRKFGLGGYSTTLKAKYQALAAKYSELAEQARGSDYDDLDMNGSSRTEPIPSETVYRLMSDMARMIVKDLKDETTN